MDALINSFVLVFISEMGDKTQLLALILTAKFKKPISIILGIFVATILNHLLASYFGFFVTQYIPENILKRILAVTFFAFAIWILIPDKEENLEEKKSWGPFLTTLVAFFFAEMGDKTQLATVALAAKYANPVWVTFGSTLGMMASNGLAVIFGQKLMNKIPLSIMHKFASLLFVGFGIGILLGF